jgi:hypothetical protein
VFQNKGDPMKIKIVLFLSLLIFSSSNLLAKKYGLILGSNYKGNKAGISELNLCEADATYMNDQIKKVGNFDEVKVLLGPQITKNNIEKEIKAIGSKAKSDDVVFLFFAGHGFFQRDAAAKNGMRNYIVCYDRPHLSDDELNEYLKTIKTQKTLFVFDCCFSGGIAKKGKSTRGDKEVPIPDGKQGTVRQDPEDFYFQNKAIIASADDNQTAIEVGGDINHGIFTYQFGRALENGDLNGDKVVTALEAFFKSRDAVIKMAEDNDHKQVPQVSGDASGIFLAGNNAPVVPPAPVDPKPEPKPDPKPEPASDPVKPDPVQPPVTPAEPPVINVTTNGDLLIKTTIIRDRAYGLTTLPPDEIIKQKKNRQGDRRVKVLIDDKEVNFKLIPVKSDYWGSVSRAGRLIQGEIYHILVKGVGTGVHKITVKADEYPESISTFAVLQNKENVLELVNAMSGFGVIQGNVFYKTLDNPVMKQSIYMPTVKSVNGVQKVLTDSEGNFWFTNLIPGDYEIKASFAENLELNNSILTIKEGDVTRVQVILNVKLPLTKTKY